MEKQQAAKPVIRFPEFTDHWNNKKLSELLKEAKKRNTDLKYTKDDVLSVSGEMGIVNQIEHLGRSYAGASVQNYHVVEVGDIVYTKSPLKANPYGIIKQNKKKAGIVSTLYAVYNVKEGNAHGEFIEHYFSLDENTNRYLRPLVKKGAKNDMKISNAYVLNDKIFVPSVAEQQKITLFLNTLDKKIEQLKQKKRLLEEYKKGIMQKIFAQELRFKDKNGKKFPEWLNKKLSERASFFSGGTPLTTKKEYYDGNIPFIKSGEINKDKTEQFISEEALKSSSAKMVKKGDLLYALYGATSGEVSISKINGAINQAVLCISSEIFNKVFLLNYLQFQKGAIVEKYIQGGQGNLSAEIVKKLNIPFPSLEEQEKIAAFLATIDDKISRTQAQITDTIEYKKGLLQKMFV
jgi:type I restriction enzyme S subunit